MDARSFFGNKGFMNDIQAPGRFFPVDQADFFIRVPASVADPPAAVIVQPVHTISVERKSPVFFLADLLAQFPAEEFIGIQEQNVIVLSQDRGRIFLGAISGKSLLEKTAPQ